MQNSLIEAGKEFLRVFLIAVVTTILPVVLEGIDTQYGVIAVRWNIVQAQFAMATAISLGKAIDKFIFLSWSVKEEVKRRVTTGWKGLVGF